MGTNADGCVKYIDGRGIESDSHRHTSVLFPSCRIPSIHKFSFKLDPILRNLDMIRSTIRKRDDAILLLSFYYLLSDLISKPN